MAETSKVSADREILLQAHERGGMAVPAAFVRLSGPGWLQSAITLGGGSLTGALFLGVLGGTKMLWLQLVAIIMGVVMLSAISYVTLSTGKRPFAAINEYINPVLGCGWLLATSAANMIWAMPQFSLCFAALEKNLTDGMSSDLTTKLTISAVLLAFAFVLVILNERRGWAMRVFDTFLKALVGMIVLCFFGVVVYLISTQGLNWGEILSGFIPNLSQWNTPTGQVAAILEQSPEAFRQFWKGQIVDNQRSVMIGAAATAVGINMTFLLPYSMLARGWDKPFRGLARFDLATGMAIPYVLVTSCVVIASAFSFHGQADEQFLSDDPATMTESSIFNGARSAMEMRVQLELGQQAVDSASSEQLDNWQRSLTVDTEQVSEQELRKLMIAQAGQSAWNELSEEEQLTEMARLPESEKLLAATLVQRNAFQLAQSLSPLLGEQWSKLVFGLGVLGMGFSTIIILMLINGYVFRELAPEAWSRPAHLLGCLVAGLSGASWPFVWTGDSQFWLAILTSTFGMMLLPVAYITFFFMMNSKDLLGENKPQGISMLVWNVLMTISVLGACVAAASAIWTKMSDPVAGPTVVGIAVFFALLTIAGFAARPKRLAEAAEEAP